VEKKFKMPKKFIRRNWTKASRLGKGRKKKQVWRAPKGRHSKTRKKRKGYPVKVMIGFKQSQKAKPILINNVNELGKIKKGEIAIIGKIGAKKKIEIAKRAKEKGIPIHNLNVNKILKKIQKKEAKAQENKKK
jgi:large subunit ribosomal protein L32e